MPVSYTHLYINFSVNNALIELHIWNTIHEQAADSVLSLIYCNLMASLVKLVLSLIHISSHNKLPM